MNIVEFGKNIYGIREASRYYFGKNPSALRLDEMVRLAAVLPSPLRLKPNRMKKSLYWRSNMILKRLKKYNYINNSEFQKTSLKLDTLYYKIQPEKHILEVDSSHVLFPVNIY